MAVANPGGGPETNPSKGPPVTSSTPVNGPATEKLDNYFKNHYPHSSDHGRGIFDHISTNRGASPGTLNGEPAANPGRGTTPIRRVKNPNPGGFGGGAVSGSSGTTGKPRGTTPFPSTGVTETGRTKPSPRSVDIPMPPTLTGDTSGTPGQSRAGY